MKNKQMILAVAIAVLVGGGAGFFGGMTYQKSQRPQGFFNGRQGQGGSGPGGAGRFGDNRSGGMNFQPVRGEILSVDAKSMTVKLPDGSSKLIVLSDNTVYAKTDKVEKTALSVGTTVMVLGTQNSDGSVTAQDIQLNPMMRFGTPSGQRDAGR